VTDKTLSGAINDTFSRDPIREAEEEASAIAGQLLSYKDEGPVGKAIMVHGFRKNLELSNTKRTLAAFNRDTHMGSKIEDYLAIAKDLGFKLCLQLDVPPSPRQPEQKDRFYIMTTEDGLVLKFDSYGGSINGGKLLFNWANNDPENRYLSVPGSGCWRALDIKTNTIIPNSSFKFEFCATC